MASILFKGVVVKKLSAVETDRARSNQHEFNGSRALIDLFGRQQPQRLQAIFLTIPATGDLQTLPGQLTWYDARARHPTRSEYRLYYYDNPATDAARPGDNLIIGLKNDGTVFVLIAPGAGEHGERIAWLFGIEVEPGAAFSALSLDDERFRLSGPHAAPTDGWEPDDTPEIAPAGGLDRDPVRQLQRLLGENYSESEASRWLPED